MVQHRTKHMKKPIGANNSTKVEPIGVTELNPPPILTGGERQEPQGDKSNQSVTDRYRVSISVPSGYHALLTKAADLFGMPLSQVALQVLFEGMPALAQKVSSFQEVKGGGSDYKK